MPYIPQVYNLPQQSALHSFLCQRPFPQSFSAIAGYPRSLFSPATHLPALPRRTCSILLLYSLRPMSSQCCGLRPNSFLRAFSSIADSRSGRFSPATHPGSPLHKKKLPPLLSILHRQSVQVNILHHPKLPRMVCSIVRFQGNQSLAGIRPFPRSHRTLYIPQSQNLRLLSALRNFPHRRYSRRILLSTVRFQLRQSLSAKHFSRFRSRMTSCNPL